MSGKLRDELRPKPWFERKGLDSKFFFSVMRYDSPTKVFRIFMNVVRKALNDGEPDGVRGEDQRTMVTESLMDGLDERVNEGALISPFAGERNSIVEGNAIVKYAVWWYEFRMIKRLSRHRAHISIGS